MPSCTPLTLVLHPIETLMSIDHCDSPLTIEVGVGINIAKPRYFPLACAWLADSAVEVCLMRQMGQFSNNLLVITRKLAGDPTFKKTGLKSYTLQVHHIF